MLGIKQVAVIVNKMDLVDYSKKRFKKIKKDYTEFLKKIGIKPREFIAISAKEGDNVANVSKKMNWFDGKTSLKILDGFDKEKLPENKPFRMSVQDIYKFTSNDNKRIVAGRVDSGSLKKGEKVLFLPSYKRSTVKSVEEFNNKKKEIKAGESTGVTLTEQIYVKRGDVMCKQKGKLPLVGYGFKGNVFWMGKIPLVMNKEYKLKIGTQSLIVEVKKIHSVLDASSMKKVKKGKVERHEVGECEILAKKPIAFDLYSKIKSTGRFVLIENYEVRGGGIITDKLESELDAFKEISEREKKWDYGEITKERKVERYAQKAKVIFITGKTGLDKKSIAKSLEKRLFDAGRFVSFLGIRNILRGLDRDVPKKKKEEHLRRLGELAHILLQTGMIAIITASDLDKKDVKRLRVLIGAGDVYFVNLIDKEKDIGEDLTLKVNGVNAAVNKIIRFLKEKGDIY
jgi:bifunctional enzyme CysN/CysC